MKAKLSNQKIGAAIRAIRINAGMSQVLLSDKIKRTSTFLWSIESGSSKPSIQTLMRICKALNLTPKQLMIAAGVKKEADIITAIFEYYNN